jgi:hypothetical protein
LKQTQTAVAWGKGFSRIFQSTEKTPVDFIEESVKNDILHQKSSDIFDEELRYFKRHLDSLFPNGTDSPGNLKYI